jgi:hypothetical protein
VHDPELMRLSETGRDLRREPYRLFRRQRSSPQALVEGLSLDQLHYQKRGTVLVADVVEGADVGMREPRDRFGFTLQALFPGRIGRETLRQHLDRDVALEPRIARPVHLAHAAGAEESHDFVGPELRALSQGHRAAIITPGLVVKEDFPCPLPGELALPLSLGTRLGPYRIASFDLGSGTTSRGRCLRENSRSRSGPGRCRALSRT